MTLSTADFRHFHLGVHQGREPFAWQQRLLEQVVAEKAWPQVLDLPTGAGKTTCIDIALFALALDATSPPEDRWCPRRIAMVVDRRIVVDQVAERGRRILRALMMSKDALLLEVATRLRSMTRSGEEPVGVFTLRGGMPKDDGWARTPDQPLIIASTVDQVGSRMLMQGYGVSPGMKPVHAGLLANDTLLLLDEVHLSEPFRQTLDQLAHLRTRFSAGGLRTRFSHAFLSATPGTAPQHRFALRETETAIDSPLGPRLHATKPAKLLEVDDRPSLEKACLDHAVLLLERHRTVAVVVNRIGSARVIARQLEEQLRTEAIVSLLTGRMRPLDRDNVLRELRPAVETGRDRSVVGPKRVVVGTQCIEAGADFDFDALVTEAASLDSLRQRFGRVDRLGTYTRAEGVIVFDKSVKQDPVYGEALAETFKWLRVQEKERARSLKGTLKDLKDEARRLRGDAKDQADAKIARMLPVDFGILAMRPPGGDELQKLLAPKPSAPTLLPAYLDLWAQTSPAPSQVPDVSLWLHGPSSGPPDVQVVWRADLPKEVLDQGNVETATAIVAAIRPSNLEAMSVPFATVRAWLAGQPGSDISDTEGQPIEDVAEPRTFGRRALRWNGDESQIVCAQSDAEPSLRPGDTIIVPAGYGGIRSGSFDPAATETVRDCAEQAELLARARPRLRLNAAVTENLGLSIPLEEPEEARVVLGQLAAGDVEWPAWKRLWAEQLSKGRGSFVVLGEPPWTVIEARGVSLAKLRGVFQPDETSENGLELTTDGDDSFHAGRAVSLAEHSADVEAFAREYATQSGLGIWLAEHVAMAAWLHDVGKADPRFQLMLRGGSEIDFLKDESTWAKSPMPPGAREAHRRAQHRSGYPRGARHEVQSLAMVETQREALCDRLKRVDPSKEPDLDLVLHLIATHHGFCRPLAPAVSDESPVKMTLAEHKSDSFGTIGFAPTASNNELHRLDSPLADRFWALVARYGWQELCWLEAILRLADHRASEEEMLKEALA